jgi:hypothetical protein
MKNWVIIIIVLVALSLNGCAKDATAEDSPITTPAKTSTETRTNLSTEVIWIAIVTIWNPVNRTIDKEFTSEVNCWNYYENGVGESKFSTQHLDHQGNKPDKNYMNKNRPPHREYPTRMYHGITDEQGQVWLTCDIKGTYKGL